MHRVTFLSIANSGQSNEVSTAPLLGRDGRALRCERRRAADDMTVSHDDRLRITYQLAPQSGLDPKAVAEDIALEQSVELPRRCLKTGAEGHMVGQVEDIAADRGGSRVVVSFHPGLVGGDVLQLVNVLFGNISLKRGILIVAVEWPLALLGEWSGPRFGTAGVRALCRADPERPLVCAALKPVGLSARELARRCFTFAASGVDIVKDDHGLTDQAAAPFRERVERCQEAVERANGASGGHSVYFPNVTAPRPELDERLTIARAAGCRGVLVSPLLVGLGTLHWISDRAECPLLSHPAMAGAFFGGTHGIAPDVLLGTLFRIAGSDGVIYPNVGGRFNLTADDCTAINARLREPLGPVCPSFPVPGGGIDVQRAPEWIRRYGPDTILLIGASLYEQSDLKRATEALVRAVRRGASVRGE